LKPLTTPISEDAKSVCEGRLIPLYTRFEERLR
jgi:hypothetical protein